MNKNNRKEKKKDNLNILKFIGPGLLVTVGFIDPGNWASILQPDRDMDIPCSGW